MWWKESKTAKIIYFRVNGEDLKRKVHEIKSNISTYVEFATIKIMEQIWINSQECQFHALSKVENTFFFLNFIAFHIENGFANFCDLNLFAWKQPQTKLSWAQRKMKINNFMYKNWIMAFGIFSMNLIAHFLSPEWRTIDVLYILTFNEQKLKQVWFSLTPFFLNHVNWLASMGKLKYFIESIAKKDHCYLSG